MATNVSSSSVCKTNGLITNVGTTAMKVDTSIKAEYAIDLSNRFQLTNEGLQYNPSWSNTHYSPISGSLTTKEWINMKENILDINVIVPNKVVEITFYDMMKEKMVCHKDDTFDLRSVVLSPLQNTCTKKNIHMKVSNIWQNSLCIRKSM